MDFEFPKLADTLVEGTVSRWLRRVGDPVQKGEPLVEVETDKVNTELESPTDGVLAEILAPEGATVPVGEVIARIETPGTAGSSPRQQGEARWGAGSREERLAEHLRLAAESVPQGVCAREVDARAIDRLAEVARAQAPEIELAVKPPSRAHLAMPPLPDGSQAILVAGEERDGRRFLTLCFDRRVMDDWAADQLLKRIADNLEA
jgi:pyruvate/2-oxoglutarate dehydrogenase complex dihydrolipoamide acyltransferase (E2) component